MTALQERLAASERRACRVVSQPRSTQAYRSRCSRGEDALVKRMVELAGLHVRCGYRMIWAYLVQEGWRVNRKRVYRLWRREGLKVRTKARKKRRLGSSDNSCKRRKSD